MPQERLNCQVARAIGEDRRTIVRLGFNPLRPMPFELETDDPGAPLVVDWDELDLERYLAMSG
jgi:hypothetical protein